MGLRIQITTGSNTPIYRQVVEQVRLAVATGRLAPGDALPSVRALAQELLVNPNTIAKAYAELTRAAIAEVRPGRGLFITDKPSPYSRAEQTRRLEEALDAFLHETICLGLSAAQVHSLFEKRLARIVHLPTEEKR